eukprot:gene18207-20025_t
MNSKHGINSSLKRKRSLEVDYQESMDISEISLHDNQCCSEKIEIFVGNLKPGIKQDIINKQLQGLFLSRGIQTNDEDFSVLRRGAKKIKHLFVVLDNEKDRQELIEAFNGMKCSDIVVDKKCLRVSERRCQHGNKCQKTKKKKDDASVATLESRLGSSRSAPTIGTAKIRRILRFGGQDSLRVGQILGNESRRVEYKRGGGKYLKKCLMGHVRRYVCAFLNSEGGKLHIGVGDNGKVYGVPCTRKDEDSMRILIDSVISKFQPPVFPAMYSVKFIPVIHQDSNYDTTNSLENQCFKVLEIEVYNQTVSKQLYETDKGEVFIRRDGSVQGPLKASQIIEWCRLHQVNASENHQQVKNNMHGNMGTDESSADNCDASINRGASEDSFVNSNMPPFAIHAKIMDEPLMRMNRIEASIHSRQDELEKEINDLRTSGETRERLLQEELEKSRSELQKRRRPTSGVCIII